MGKGLWGPVEYYHPKRSNMQVVGIASLRHILIRHSVFRYLLGNLKITWSREVSHYFPAIILNTYNVEQKQSICFDVQANAYFDLGTSMVNFLWILDSANWLCLAGLASASTCWTDPFAGLATSLLGPNFAHHVRIRAPADFVTNMTKKCVRLGLNLSGTSTPCGEVIIL